MTAHLVQGIWMVGLPMLLLGLLLLWIFLLAGSIEGRRTRRSIRGYLLVAFIFLLPTFGFTWLLRWHVDDLLAQAELEGELLRHTEMARAICTGIVLGAVTSGALSGIAVVLALQSKALPLHQSLEEAMATDRPVRVAVMGPVKDTTKVRIFIWPEPAPLSGAIAADVPAEQVPADLRAPTTEFLGVFDRRGALVSIERASTV